ncbi:MAG: hypothetical protein ACK2T2_05760 [Anaerolineales bacterium]
MRGRGVLLLLIGLLIGLVAGLYYSWVVNPVEYVDSAPSSLRQNFKDDYLALIASAYAHTGDLQRTRARLASLQLDDPASALSRLAQSRLAEGRPESEVLALAQLAAVLGQRPVPGLATGASPGTATPIAPTPSPTASPTATRTPTPMPTATPGAPYTLLDQEEVCDIRLGEAQMQVLALDAAGEGVPGVELFVIWDAGQDRFYTGLKPELGPGYADFTMLPGVTYTLQLSSGDRPVAGLMAPECFDDDGNSFPGSWRLIFQQPPQP